MLALAVLGSGLVAPVAAAASTTDPPTTAVGSESPHRTGVRGRARADEDADPLLLTLTSLSPSTLGGRAPIKVSGTVHNGTSEDYADINLMAFASATPILDTATLASSAAIAADEYVGNRITTPGTYATLDSLPAGATADFSFTLEQSELGVSEAGVYWFGVHALGETATQPRDEFAEGRVRTFLPLVPRGGADQSPAVPVSVVLPVREIVATTANGKVARARSWLTSLSSGGRLDTLLEAGEVADSVTWLLDPGVLAAVARLAAGNPARSLAPDPALVGDTEAANGEERPDPLPTVTSGVVPASAPDRDLTTRQQQVADAAQAWLNHLSQVTQGHDVLVLPYGDLDVSAAAANDPTAYERATNRAQQVLEALGLTGRPALAPRDGVLSREALELAGPDTTILMSDTAFTVPPEAPDSVVQLLGHKVLMASAGAASGGPTPTPPDDPLALRQRLLSEVEVRRLSGSTAPLVLMLPADWAPEQPADLFDALGEPWLSSETVASLLDAEGIETTPADLAYTEEDLGAQLPAASFGAAEDLAEAGAQMASSLALPSLVRQQTVDEGLLTLSEGLRGGSVRATNRAMAAESRLRDQLSSITVVAPEAVSLSSDNGSLGVDIINGLDQPIAVRLAARSDDGIELSDVGLRQIAGNARIRLRPQLSTTRPGIHRLQLVVTDDGGTPLGDSTSIQVRAAEVSNLIWLLMAAGAVILFTTIAFRLRTRAKEGRPLRREVEVTHDPEDPRPGSPGEARAPEAAAADDEARPR